MSITSLKIVKGRRYLVKYLPSGARSKLAQFVGTAMSPNDDGRLAFNGRPAFGTAYIEPEAIFEATETSQHHQSPRSV